MITKNQTYMKKYNLVKSVLAFPNSRILVFLFPCISAFLLFGCAEDDFTSSNWQKTDGHISFITCVTEMEDLDATRGGGHHNAAHHHDMAGAATPMFARFTQTNNIDKYFRSRRQGEQGTWGEQDDTRGRRIDSIPDFYDSFGLISFMYDTHNTWATIGSSLTPYVYNEQVRRADGWKTQEYWPGSGARLTFFAYAPYNAQGMTLSSATDVGTPWLHHVVPDEAHDQSDLLISAYEHEAGNYNASRHIDFRHICAGVRFGIGSQMAPGAIKKIQLVDVYGEGWYHFGAAAWDSVKTKKTFTLNQTFTIAPGESNKLLTTGDNVFMMVPQEVPSMSKIRITIDDGEEHILESIISFDSWDMGTTTTYWLSTSVAGGDTVLYVTNTYAPSSPTGIPYSGGSATYEVGSYYITAYGTRSPIAWTASYTIDNNTTVYTATDSVVTAMNFMGGTTPVTTNTITLASQTGIENTSADGSWGNDKSGVFDLSTHDLNENTISQTTANCYVIDAKGTYSLPLVYGNAIKNGAANPNAYGGGTIFSQTFVDHNNVLINSPYIYLSNSGANAPDGATLVWQTEPGLIASVSLANGNHDLQFTVGNLKEGNAIVAATRNGVIVWSWHIWVTKRKKILSSTIAVDDYDNNSIKYNFMPVALGATGFSIASTLEYAERLVEIKILQGGSNQNASVIIKQVYGVEPLVSSIGVAPFYQGGRKDPLPPSTGTSTTTAPLYDISDNTYSGFGFLCPASNMGITIQNPNKQCRGSGYYIIHDNGANPGKNDALDYWNVGTTQGAVNSNTIVKSVYDPSPQGFCMPPSAAFRVFSSDGDRGSLNIAKAWNNNLPGHFFYTVKSSSVVSGTTPTIFFPAYGWRWDGNLYGVRGNGNYISAGRSTTGPWQVLFTASGIETQHEDPYRPNALCIFSVSE